MTVYGVVIEAAGLTVTGFLRALAGPDQGDDFVQVVQGDHQALEDMGAGLRLLFLRSVDLFLKGRVLFPAEESALSGKKFAIHFIHGEIPSIDSIRIGGQWVAAWSV